MKKVLLLIGLVLMLTAGMGMLPGCSAEEVVEEAPLAPCKINVEGILLALGEEKTIALDTTISIQNPNDFEITLENINYTLVSEGLTVGTRPVFDKFYIPANKEIRLTYTTFAFATPLIVGQTWIGKSAQEAGGFVMPIWGKISKSAAAFQVEGEANISSSKGEKMTVPFDLSWQAQ